MYYAEEELLKVRDLKEQLCKIAQKKNLQDPQVISLSKEIDRLLNEIDKRGHSFAYATNSKLGLAKD